MQPIDKAIAILAGTQDGAQLSAKDLKLTELAANNNLTEVGLDALDTLYQAVQSGSFNPTGGYLFGIEYLTRNWEGYVAWKGKVVEHYSHQDADEMKRDAETLAERCLALEAKGFPVSGRSVIEPIFEQAPAGTPWLEAMNRFYTLFSGAGRHVAVLYRQNAPEVVIAELDKTTKELKLQHVDDAYDAFHFVQDQGLRSGSPYQDYNLFVAFFEAAGMTPQTVQQALA